VVGVYALPLGLGLNFLVNGEDYLVPMAVEEPSVIAAASNAAVDLVNEGKLDEAGKGSLRGLSGNQIPLHGWNPESCHLSACRHRDQVPAGPTQAQDPDSILSAPPHETATNFR